MMAGAWQQDKALPECMLKMYELGLGTDVILHCKDHDGSEGINAHKVVLSARSPFFQRMLFDLNADNLKTIELKDTEARHLDLFLRYLYSDTTTLENPKTASAILKLANQYGVTNLVDFCIAYLESILSHENTCQILAIAISYSIESLIDACCYIIDQNAGEILRSDEFLELPGACLRFIVRGDTFNADEKEIFTRVEEWAACRLKRENRPVTGETVKDVLGEAFFQLRLPTMSPKTLIECTRRKGYFSPEQYEDLLGHINHVDVPGAAVNSNSSIARIPKQEELAVSNMSVNINTSFVLTSFEVSVSRDVRLANITFEDIKHGIVYGDQKRYMVSRSPKVDITEPSINKFFSKYEGRVVKLAYKSIQTLKEVRKERLSNQLDVMLSGSIHVFHSERTTDNNQLLNIKPLTTGEDTIENVSNETAYDLDDQINEFRNVRSDVDEEEFDTNDSLGNFGTNVSRNQESWPIFLIPKSEVAFSEQEVIEERHNVAHAQLVSKQEFNLPFSKFSGEKFQLDKPVMMTKEQSPYIVQLSISYPVSGNTKLTVPCSIIRNNTITSSHGHIKVTDVKGAFAGIKSIGFENTSNRGNP